MYRPVILAALMLSLASPLAAQTAVCPPTPDREAEKDVILRELRTARDPTDAQIISAGLWRIWLSAPDAQAQDMLDRGIAARESYDFLGARDIFDDLVAYCPDYLEGYNQRAFANFLRQDYAAALVDLERVVQDDPRHVAALAGIALTLMGLQRDEEAQVRLRQALRLNAWLKERSLLTGPPEQEL